MFMIINGKYYKYLKVFLKIFWWNKLQKLFKNFNISEYRNYKIEIFNINFSKILIINKYSSLFVEKLQLYFNI
jgi:hypothetical protein